jgi:phosphatidylglycerol:prolipoprotein diacylglycerol transferase
LLVVSIIALGGGPAAGVMAAFALAAPWALVIGRLRCVVQGCCHGRPVEWGIRVTNPHSRVVTLAGFSGTPIYPTPLYSILANLVIGLVLLRLRVIGTGPFQIAGLYLLLAGMSRFAEEAYRGEPQTKRFAGLPLYQWMAAGSVVLGMVVMALRAPPLPPMRGPTAWLVAAAALWGALCAFAMSMDFPASQRRFSRLTG